MDKLHRRQKRKFMEGLTPQALSKARSDNRLLRQEIVQLRKLLASVMEERDQYKEKLRQALGAMEDAREMALERAS